MCRYIRLPLHPHVSCQTVHLMIKELSLAFKDVDVFKILSLRGCDIYVICQKPLRAREGDPLFSKILDPIGSRSGPPPPYQNSPGL